MGCSYDVIRAKVRVQDRATFVTMYNEILKDELYDDVSFASPDCFDDKVVDGRVNFVIDQNPLFKIMEEGNQVTDFFCKYLFETKDEGFTAEYECTYDDCGAMVVRKCSYQDEILTIESKLAEEGYLMECPECGYEDTSKEHLLDLHTWTPDKEMTCPECEAILELSDVQEETEEINVVEYCEEVYWEDGEVVVIENFDEVD